MKKFMDKDFLLSTKTAKKLFHDYSENLPIIDYHCHVSPQEIAEDRKFENITQVWLGGDHYKWRLMRSNGVEENEITGDADDFTKFQRFAESLEKAIGNPMYHWCHLELKKYFGYNGVLNGKTAEKVWNICNAALQSDKLSVRGIIKASNVDVIGTTDDPIDTLEWHKKIKEDETFKTKVVPSYRPDKAVAIDKAGFTEYIEKLSAATDIEIKTVEDVKAALLKTMDKFGDAGCKISDHGLDYVPFETKGNSEEAFKAALAGKEVSTLDADTYKTELVLFCGKEYFRRGWVMQIHFGAMRNPNSVMFEKLGPDTGYDCIAGSRSIEALAKMLDALCSQSTLPKTIVYSLNPIDNAALGSLIGAFQNHDARGKIQHGSAWWFNDNKTGMQQQMTDLANLSILGNFVGMLTDSRSFLSYTRHEYFRRIMCELLGSWAENGEFPADIEALGKIASDISYYNAKKYFGF